MTGVPILDFHNTSSALYYTCGDSCFPIFAHHKQIFPPFHKSIYGELFIARFSEHESRKDDTGPPHAKIYLLGPNLRDYWKIGIHNCSAKFEFG